MWPESPCHGAQYPANSPTSKRETNAKHAAKTPTKIQRQNEKIKYDVDARFCHAHKQAYKRFVNEEIISDVIIYWLF